MKLAIPRRPALAAGAAGRARVRRQRAEDPADRLHRARDRPAQGLSGRLREGQSEHRNHLGARLDRHHHGQAARREGQSAGRRDHGPRRDQPGDLRGEGMLAPYAPAGLSRIAAAVSRSEEPADLGRHGRLGRDDLLQHRRGREAQHPEARDLEGPDQAGLQGPDRDAAPGLLGHRLLRRHRVAADVGRGGRLEVHGRRCTRTSRSTCTRARARARQPAPANSSSASRSSTAPTARRRAARRSTSCSRRKAWAGTSRRSAS